MAGQVVLFPCAAYTCVSLMVAILLLVFIWGFLWFFVLFWARSHIVLVLQRC
jgi:hypothetical protein